MNLHRPLPNQGPSASQQDEEDGFGKNCQFLFEQSQKQRRETFEQAVGRRRHIFKIKETQRQLEFEVKQRKRKALFLQKEEEQDLAFREAQEARWRWFTNGEAERERIFCAVEHERNLSALGDERQREVLLQMKLEDLRQQSTERGQQLISDIDTWRSELLKKRESKETMQFRLEEGQRMWNFHCLFI